MQGPGDETARRPPAEPRNVGALLQETQHDISIAAGPQVEAICEAHESLNKRLNDEIVQVRAKLKEAATYALQSDIERVRECLGVG